jgi:hypothetical protein
MHPVFVVGMRFPGSCIPTPRCNNAEIASCKDVSYRTLLNFFPGGGSQPGARLGHDIAITASIGLGGNPSNGFTVWRLMPDLVPSKRGRIIAERGEG